MNKIILLAVFVATSFGCGPSKGTLTVTNTTLTSARIVFEGKGITLAPEQHFTEKNLNLGLKTIKINDNPPLELEISKGKTTLVDIGGENCFIVADYTLQYGEKGTGVILVVEKFVNETSFSTASNITSQLGEALPKGLKGHKKVTRLHRIDCSWIDNNQAIVDAIANLP